MLSFWHLLQVIVPGAELQEIIPAARLLQTATSLTPAEYEQAKQAFLSAVKATKIEAQVPGKYVCGMQGRRERRRGWGQACPRNQPARV